MLSTGKFKNKNEEKGRMEGRDGGRNVACSIESQFGEDARV